MLHPQPQQDSILQRKEVPDGLLVGQALAGDQSAFELLVNRYHHRLVNHIQGFLKDHDRSYDVLQQVYLQLYLSLPILLTNVSLKPGSRARPRLPLARPGRTPYEVVVAEMLLQRTTANGVARAYAGFVERFPSWVVLAQAPLEDLENALRPFGLWRRKGWHSGNSRSRSGSAGASFPARARN